MSAQKNMRLQIQTEDRYIYDKTRIWKELIRGHLENQNIVLDLSPEGPCAASLGLYELLDNFCEVTKTDPRTVVIRTANMLENHPRYTIVKDSDYWYEVKMIRTWWQQQSIDTGVLPSRHFGNFVGRSRWPRLWMATWLDKFHKDKTLQTFHSSLRCNYRTEKDHGVYDWIGLEDLVNHDCDIIADVVQFLDQCPKYIEDDLSIVKNTEISFRQPSHYPLQHPANLNIINFYYDIFVDIIIEPNMAGTCFLSTEKLWRCMLAKRPFIVIANKDHLYNLQKLGFDTFYHWWDESYDGYENQSRIRSAQQVIDQIATWPIAKLHETLIEMRAKLEHNYQRFLELDRQDFCRVFGAI